MATRQQLLDLCRDVLAPVIHADDGELYVVEASDDSLTLHLGGTCSGCPGASTTIRTLIEPSVRALSNSARVKVTVGARVPAGASRVQPSSEHDEVAEQDPGALSEASNVAP